MPPKEIVVILPPSTGDDAPIPPPPPIVPEPDVAIGEANGSTAENGSEPSKRRKVEDGEETDDEEEDGAVNGRPSNGSKSNQQSNGECKLSGLSKHLKAKTSMHKNKSANGDAVSLPTERDKTESTVPSDEEEEEKNGYGSSTSAEDLELCEYCKREGEVLECDFEGCEKLWHAHCVKDLRGKIPEGRWICPGPHEERCDVCKGSGEVILCDVKNCGRMYHLKCLPGLKSVPEGFWECPKCIAEREAGLYCTVCNLARTGRDDNLVKCIACNESVHLSCLGAYGARAAIACANCNFQSLQQKASKRRTNTVQVKLVFAEGLSRLEQARLVQIIRGEATGLTEEEAMAFLSAGIARKKL